jgi:AcrR family transcriptional regulator
MGSLEFNSQRVRLAGGAVDLTKKRILAAAELVFSRDGFQGATTREIARQAGVNEVTLFRHFRTREAAAGNGGSRMRDLRGAG